MAVFGRRKIYIPQWIVGIERLNCLLNLDANDWIIVKDKALILLLWESLRCELSPGEGFCPRD
jgi:hypothetical protein